jgi:hypothetical protein
VKTGFAIAAAALMYFFPELWVETSIALGIGLMLFWWVPEPWQTTTSSSGSKRHVAGASESTAHGWEKGDGVVINPATGLPMVNAQVDVDGNPFGAGTLGGVSISSVSCSPCNPANGLPMMDTLFDVAGNPFGTSSSDSHWE